MYKYSDNFFLHVKQYSQGLFLFFSLSIYIMYPPLHSPFMYQILTLNLMGKLWERKNVPIFAAETKHYGGRNGHYK